MNALATLASDGPAADTVTPGVLGFIAVAAIGVALFFLMKSMRNRLAAIQVERGEPASAEDSAGAGTAETAGPEADPGTAGSTDAASPSS
ncbi:hypothetical protein [Streptomonospora wellingtoniae]|uniref:LPXTG cell wall anchor domain-containing protein n=1 Tax=Streptomonospora wellingtoniae TaxID=3075544 RepID=A0ABU2KZ08_9ACTN|nr:hypothetical protein [Streptomonospora sp. DSM 45055]MDT0304536.1 hypothetical protein [Streptomonospora sp. DSM 45055]